MTVTAANLVLGPADIYVGLFGATEPADGDVSAAPSSADWTGVGATLGGVTLTMEQQYANLEADQLTMPAGARRTSLAVTVKAKMAELTLENLTRALNMLTSDISSGSGYRSLSLDPDNGTGEPNYAAILFDGIGPSGNRRRAIVRRNLATGAVETAATKDEQQGWEVTWNAYYVSSAIKPVKVVDEA
jgi:hypothetical protein